MELYALQNIAEGTVSLEELERENPILGRNLKHFVETVNGCCRKAYDRLSSRLDDVLTLPAEPSEKAKERVLKGLRDASDSVWFRDVERICDDLAAIANTYEPDIMKHVEDERHGDRERRRSLLNLMRILQKHEADLKQDIRDAVDSLKIDVSDSSIREAKQRARSIKAEIASNLTRINGVAIRITGSGADGANEVLKRQIAEAALRRPERVLLFNMAMVVILLIVGATVLQFIPLWAFPLLTGFVLTAVIVVNAFYLRSINQLTNESFIELMKLALLKFFAPLARQSQSPPQTPSA